MRVCPTKNKEEIKRNKKLLFALHVRDTKGDTRTTFGVARTGMCITFAPPGFVASRSRVAHVLQRRRGQHRRFARVARMRTNFGDANASVRQATTFGYIYV